MPRIHVFMYSWASGTFTLNSPLSAPPSVTSKATIHLFPPRLIVSSKVFQVVCVHLVYNSALFLASFRCSFLLRVVATLICIFWVYRQLVLLSTFQNFLIAFVVQKSVPAVRLKYFNSTDVNRFLYVCVCVCVCVYIYIYIYIYIYNILRSQISLPYTKIGSVRALYASWKFLDQVGLKVLFRIPSISSNFASSSWMYFSLSFSTSAKIS